MRIRKTSLKILPKPREDREGAKLTYSPEKSRPRANSRNINLAGYIPPKGSATIRVGSSLPLGAVATNDAMLHVSDT